VFWMQSLLKLLLIDLPLILLLLLLNWLNLLLLMFLLLELYHCSSVVVLELKLNTYHYIHSNRIYFKQAYNVINNLFITRTNILHTKCRQLFRWDPAPSTCPTSTKAEDMGLPTSWCLSKKTYRCCIYLVSTI
jgi:hypothetical protein